MPPKSLTAPVQVRAPIDLFPDAETIAGLLDAAQQAEPERTRQLFRDPDAEWAVEVSDRATSVYIATHDRDHLIVRTPTEGDADHA